MQCSASGACGAPGVSSAGWVIAGLAALLLTVTPARADVRDFLGRPLTSVRVEVGGQPLADPALLPLIETRVGDALSMRRVRETIDHLVGLGRFQDIRVRAEAAEANSDGVALVWTLVPVQRLARVQFEGQPALSQASLRAEINERVGLLPPTTRVAEIVQALTAFHRERGYQQPQIRPRLAPGRQPEEVTLILAIDAGVRTTIGNVTVQGETGQTPASLIADLRLAAGRPYDRPAIDTRIAAFTTKLRDQGYYEARATLEPTLSEDSTTANLVVVVERGPRVRVVFAGDPLPENRRETLVPVRRERSVDLDLLEDASRNIEAYLRQQGYRSADASYVREERGGEMVLTFTATRGPLHRLASLDVVGNRAVSSAEIAPLLKVQPNEPYTEARITAIVAAIGELYRVRGFSRATVRPEMSLQSDQTTDGQPYRPVAIKLAIAEGVQTTVSTVAIDGAVEIPEPQVRSLLVLTPGRPFYRPQLDTDRDAIERLYHNEGFRDVLVDVQPVLAEEGARLELRWTIREGPRTLVDHVLVTGNERTGDDLIRREIVLQPGKPLGDDAMLESQRRLAALGLFRRVRIVDIPHQTSADRDVLVEVEESPSTTIDYGGGLEAGRRVRLADDGSAEERIDVAPRGFFQISRRNLFGKNRSISLFTRVSLRPSDPAVDSTDPADVGGYGFNEYRVVGTYREPRLIDSPGDLLLTTFFEQGIRSSFNFSRRGVRAEYARRFGPVVTVSGRYAIDRTRLFDEKIEPEDQLLIDRLFPQVRLSTITGSVLRDSRNDVLDPERGKVLGIDGSLALRALGSEVGFFKSFMQAFAYRRLPGASKLTLAAGVRVGVAVGFERLVPRIDGDGRPVTLPDGTQIVDVVTDVPASERFFAGGDSTVRGFVLDRLGTEDTLNDQGFPTGGNGLVVLNAELRTPYWKGLGGVGFLDAGNVFRRTSDLSLADLRPAPGFGLRYRSPLGPLRVDFGFNLDRRMLASGTRERGTVFHISLGQAF